MEAMLVEWVVGIVATLICVKCGWSFFKSRILGEGSDCPHCHGEGSLRGSNHTDR